MAADLPMAPWFSSSVQPQYRPQGNFEPKIWIMGAQVVSHAVATEDSPRREPWEKYAVAKSPGRGDRMG